LLIAVMASFWMMVLGGRTPFASRCTIVRGRLRSCVAVIIKVINISVMVLGGRLGRWFELGWAAYFDADALFLFGGRAFVAGAGYLGYVGFARHGEGFGM